MRLPSDSGIAIGPILFVIALLGILATVIAAGTGDFGTASITDRTYNELLNQANLIRAKINECNIKYGTNNNGDGWPASDSNGTLVCALACQGDPSTSTSANDCANNPLTMQNLWSGMRPAQLPPPSNGFEQWTYVNAGAAGGRCFWTEPTNSPSQGIVAGLQKTAARFSSQEVNFDASGSSKRFVVWITVPIGTADSHCLSQ